MRKAGRLFALPARPAARIIRPPATSLPRKREPMLLRTGPALPRRRRFRASLAQAEHVVHVVEPGRLAAQPFRGAQGAHGVGRAALRAHGDLDALAGAGEEHGVLADDVAAPDGMEADFLPGALAGLALAAMARDLRQLALQRLGNDFAKFQRGARGRIDLVAVVRLDDLDVVAVAKDARRSLRQLVPGVDADGEVRRHDNRDAPRRLRDGFTLRVGKAGGADHHGTSVLEIRKRALGTCEVDEHVAACSRSRIGTDGDGAGFAANSGAARHVVCAGELELAIGEHGIDERAAHAPARAGETNFHRPAAGETMSPWMRSSLFSLKNSATLRVSRLPFSASRQYT